MAIYEPLKINPQADVITLTDAQARMSNWRFLVRSLYNPAKGFAPNGVFIPLTDILEISKLKDQVKEVVNAETKEKIPITIVGMRTYFAMDQKLDVVGNLRAIDYPIKAILIPVFQKNSDRQQVDEGDFTCLEDVPTYDLIAPVPSITGSKDAIETNYSIYDITQPCPKLCDPQSDLY